MKPEPSAMRCARGCGAAAAALALLLLEEAAQELVEGRLRRSRAAAPSGPGLVLVLVLVAVLVVADRSARRPSSVTETLTTAGSTFLTSGAKRRQLDDAGRAGAADCAQASGASASDSADAAASARRARDRPGVGGGTGRHGATSSQEDAGWTHRRRTTARRRLDLKIGHFAPNRRRLAARLNICTIPTAAYVAA